MFKTGQTAMDINTQSLPRRQTTKNTEITKKKLCESVLICG